MLKMVMPAHPLQNPIVNCRSEKQPPGALGKFLSFSGSKWANPKGMSSVEKDDGVTMNNGQDGIANAWKGDRVHPEITEADDKKN